MTPKTMNPRTIFRVTLAIFLTISPVFSAATGHCQAGQAPPQPSPAEEGSFMSFIDRYHTYLTGQVNQPAVWFDNFFGDPRADDDLPTSFVRLRLSARFTEGEGFKFPVRIRANIKLPRASRKLRLVIVGESYEELQATRPGDHTGTTAGEGFDKEKGSVGLRYTLYKNLRSLLHFGGGTSNLVPFEYYGRINYQRLVHIGSHSVTRAKQTVFWNSIDGFGETSTLDLERNLPRLITGRLSLSGTYYDSDPGTEENKGLNWTVQTSFFKHLTSKTAASLDLGVFGITRPTTKISNYVIATRIRTNILRPWLFFEIVPEISFPVNELTDELTAVGALTGMMEIQFADN